MQRRPDGQRGKGLYRRYKQRSQQPRSQHKETSVTCDEARRRLSIPSPPSVWWEVLVWLEFAQLTRIGCAECIEIEEAEVDVCMGEASVPAMKQVC